MSELEIISKIAQERAQLDELELDLKHARSLRVTGEKRDTTHLIFTIVGVKASIEQWEARLRKAEDATALAWHRR